MRLEINGNINEYYAQTLCLLFFPGSKFSAKGDGDESAPKAKIDIIDNGDRITSSVVLFYDGKSASAVATEMKARFPENEERCANIACGKAFFEAGKNLLGIAPQWGTLTGVRPSKFVYDMMSKGISKTEAIRRLKQDFLVNTKKANIAAEIAVKEKEIIKNLDKNSCSLYISIPFCPTRCKYCSFVSYSSPKLLSLIDDYIDKLCIDIADTAAMIRSLGLSLSTIYIGGGTPTTLDERQLAKLFGAIGDSFDMSRVTEFTLEAGRPDTITAEKLRVANEAGVDRISINCQTLNDDVLEAIGRKHTVADFYNAFEKAASSGIPHINTDLIVGLPGEGFLSFSYTVDRLVKLSPDNITVHTLSVKNAADFSKIKSEIYRKNLRDVSKCVDYSQIALKNAGYFPYYIYRQKNSVGNLENIGFSKPGTEGLYNIYMMEELQSIFSVGAGAVSKLVCPEFSKIKRICEYKYPYEYLSDKQGIKALEKRKAIEDFYSEIRGL